MNLLTKATANASQLHIRFTPASSDSYPRLVRKTILQIILAAVSILTPTVAQAGSATWDLNPTSGDWNTAANWTPMTVPNGPADIATFDLSNSTGVLISANTEVNAITFTPAATNPYTITASAGLVLTLSGAGITNNSGTAQNFIAAPSAGGANAIRLLFTNSATAGSATFFAMNGGATVGDSPGWTLFDDFSTADHGTFTNNGPTVLGTFGEGATLFNNSATASKGTFINNGGTVRSQFGGDQGLTNFNDTTTAARGTFINNAATVSGAHGGNTAFDYSATAANGTFANKGAIISGGGTGFDSGSGMTRFFRTSTAANGTFINDAATADGSGGGFTEFHDASTAANGTFIADGATTAGAGGGLILFFDDSSGGRSKIEIFGNGSLDVSGHNVPSVTIGSIEGDGDVFLGANNLTVGSNNLSTTFSGVIQDGGFGGSLIKLRKLSDSPELTRTSRTLVLTGALNVYDSIPSKTFVIQDGFGGSFTKIGTGALELAGINTYTGDTTVNRGVLQVNGSITSNTFVNDQGTLAGTGTVYGNIANNGTVSPGDAVGTLTVNGNYTQTARSSLLINIAGANAGEFSVLDVSGIASLNGGSVLLDPVLLNGFIPRVGQSFAFLNYASLAGAFSIRHPNIPHGIGHWEVIYQGTAAILTVAPGHSSIARFR